MHRDERLSGEQEESRVTQTTEPPNLSDLPPNNCLVVKDGFRSDHPLALVMDALHEEGVKAYARADLELPLGCPFSLFVVRGYPKDEEFPCMVASLVVCRELALALAANLDEGECLEWAIEPRR